MNDHSKRKYQSKYLANPSSYQNFRDSIYAGISEPASLTKLTGPQVPMNELELQSLWFAGAFGRDFASSDGENVHIIDFGEWNNGPGPDFTKCVIKVNPATGGDSATNPGFILSDCYFESLPVVNANLGELSTYDITLQGGTYSVDTTA